MFGNLTGWHLLIIVAIVLLLFGATKLPALAKGVGQSMRIFKQEIQASNEEDSAKSVDGASESKQTASTHIE